MFNNDKRTYKQTFLLKMKTSAKLRFLAAVLLRQIENDFTEDVYNQHSENQCVTGYGLRLHEKGYFLSHKNVPQVDSIEIFMSLYGTTEKETWALFLADYHKLNVGLKAISFDFVTKERAAVALRKLADKYEQAGN